MIGTSHRSAQNRHVDIEKVRQAHAWAGRLRGKVEVARVTDTGCDARATALINDTVSAVARGGWAPRRIKRSFGAWVDAHTKNSRAGRDFYLVTIGAGAVVCLAGAAAFAAIAWWALLPGIPVSLATYWGCKVAGAKWTKSTVVAHLRKNETPKQATVKDGRLAEYMLVTLVKESQRLQSKKKRYFQNIHGTQAPGATAQALRDQVLRSACRDGYWGSDVEIGVNLSRIRGANSVQQGKIKIAALIRRNVRMIEFTRGYLNILREQIDGFIDNLNTVDELVSRFIRSTVALGDHHINCPDDCCYGPVREDLTFRRMPLPKTAAGQARNWSRRERVENARKNYDAARAAATSKGAEGLRVNGKFLEGAVKSKSVAIPQQEARGESAESVIQAIRTEGAVSASQVAAGSAGLGGRFHEAGATDTVAGVAIGAVTEGMENWVPEAAAEAAGGMGADLAMGPVGWIMGVALTEALQSMRINRPTDRAVTKIRNAMLMKDAALNDELEETLRRAKVDFLEKALERVHTHYLPRLHSRWMKFDRDPLVKKLRRVGGGVAHCDDAVRLTRYIYKCWRIIYKAEAHIAYVARAVDKIDQHMRMEFPVPGPAAPSTAP